MRLLAVLIVLLVAGGIAFLVWPSASAIDDPVRHEPAEIEPQPGALTAAAAVPAPEHATTEPEPALERTELEDQLPPDPRAGQGSVHGDVVWADDKQPIAGVEVRLQRSVAAGDQLRAARAQTDAAGAFVFAAAAVGTHVLVSAHGGQANVKVQADKQTRVQLRVPRGVAVQGVALDDAGQRVRGAEVYLCDAMPGPLRAVVARSDDAGRFTVPNVVKRRWVGARARGHRDSAVTLIDADAPARRVELVLARHDARVRGFVRDGSGNACAGAIVVASPPGTPKWQLGADGTQQHAWAPAATVTDGKGAFEIAGLLPGELTVRAYDEEAGSAHVNVEVAAAAVADVVLDLLAPARVHGRVVASGGAAVAGAFFYFGALGDIDFVCARSDRDGEFEAKGVRPGELTVQIWQDKRLALSSTLSLAPGQTLLWNPVLGAGAALRGRVVDSAQRPLASYYVVAFQGTRWLAETTTGADGAFAFDNVETAALTLRVGVAHGNDSGRTRLTLLSVPDVVPPRDDLVLVVPADSLPSVTVFGRVLRADGAPADGATFRLASGGEAGHVETTVDAQGQFRVTAVMPGRYWASVIDVDHPTLTLEQRTFAPHAQVDLGELRLSAGGRIVATVVSATGAEAPEVKIDVLDGSGRHVGSMQRTGAALRSPVLPPGQLVLMIAGAGIARARHEATLAVGQELHVELTVQPGRRCLVRAELPAGTPPPAWLWGSLYCGREMAGGCGFERLADGAWSAEVWLDRRDHEIFVGTEGQRFSGQAVISGALADGGTVTVTLRPR